MKITNKIAISLAVMTLSIASLNAQQVPSYIERPADADDIYLIYPGNGVPAGSESWTQRETTANLGTAEAPNRRARNVTIPTITMFKPENPNGTAVIIAPGGAFHYLMMDNEGYQVAKWLKELGITAFVLKYRVQHTPETETEFETFNCELGPELPVVYQETTYPPMAHPGAEEARLWGEEDGRQAIRYIRQNAAALGINPDKIGIMGFSAGGGISVNAALQYDEMSYPNFVGGIYAGYRIVSPFLRKLPPLFLAITDDDKYVAPISSARLYEDWHKLGHSVEVHIFGNGNHGFEMRTQNKLSDQWKALYENWLRMQGFLPGAE
jgi:acetyl esterase/lipase